jgi:hypothetical protein
LSTSRNTGNDWPLANAPLQGKFVVRCNVKVQLPLASAGVIEPPPFIIPSSGSVLVSQAVSAIIMHSNSAARFT